MKRSVYVSLAIFLATAQANANGFSNESSFTAYWQVPLNISQTGQQRMAYGFRMDHLTRDFAGNQIMTTNLSQRQPLLDFRFNDRGLAGIFVHGVNLATPVALKAAEEAGAPSWLVIGGTIAAVAGLAILANNDSNSGSNASIPACTSTFALNNTACVDIYGLLPALN